MYIIIAEMESLELSFSFLTITKLKKQFWNIKYKQEVSTMWQKNCATDTQKIKAHLKFQCGVSMVTEGFGTNGNKGLQWNDSFKILWGN